MTSMSAYTAEDITVLEGLEAVRRRPGMYIGGTGNAGLHHLLWEIIDNSVDEAINGFASTIEVLLHEDRQHVTVTDNGRGIPVDIHPTEKRPALEVIFTKLHAGGKFDQGSYTTSGGLHGVGSSVVNALSSQLDVSVRRGGCTYTQSYQRGVPMAPMERQAGGRGTGTTITFSADPEIFDGVTFDAALIREMVETKSFLNKGLRIVFRDAATGSYDDFKHEGGLRDYLEQVVDREKLNPIHADAFYLETHANGTLKMELALQWTEAPTERVRTFVNGISTVDGGTHEQGLKDGVVRAVRGYVETHDLIPRGVTVSAEDIREGICGALSIFMAEPQFQGQTKEKLNNPEVRSLVSAAIRTDLEQYLHKHGSTGQAIAARVIQASRARQASRSAANSVRRKGPVRRLNLPGKLADCSSGDPSISELFLVEGDSAGGSAKQGRDRKTQAILPLRGKVLNAEQATQAKVMANKELQDIVSALGCGIGETFNPTKLRYHKIILLMDADSDGHHIATLLLTFFFRYLKPLIEEGYVYLAQPPLYRVDHAKETHWVLDDASLERLTRRIRKKTPNAKIDIQRFKGLGEMMPKTLYSTTLHPEKRRLLQVQIPDGLQLETETVMGGLMGKDVAARHGYIVEYAATAADLDI